MHPNLQKMATELSERLSLGHVISGDSRFLSLIHYSTKRVSALGKAGWLIAILALSSVISFYLIGSSITPAQQYILFMLLSAMGLWLSEAIPPFAVGILIIGFLVFTQGSERLVEDPVDVQRYVNTWSAPVIWLMLGGFFLAEGMKKTRLDAALFRLTLKYFGNQPKRILLGMMLTTSLASMLMSNTATAAMMLASILPLIKKNGAQHPLSFGLLVGIPAAASVGGMGTIIGSPPNAIAVGALSAMGIEISFLDWMYFGVPVALLLCLSFWFLLQRKIANTTQVDLSFAEQSAPLNKQETQQRYIVLFVLFLTVGLWMTTPLHGIPVAMVSGIPIVLLTISSIIWAKDVRSLPWDTLMLVAGGLALGMAMVDTGLAALIVDQLEFGSNLWLLLPLFGLLTMILSNVMSNTATSTILIPIALLMVAGNPSHMLLIALVIALSASCALFLPVSTPPNAIAFSTGFIQQKDFRLGGWFIGFSGPLGAAGWSALLYFLFLAS